MKTIPPLFEPEVVVVVVVVTVVPPYLFEVLDVETWLVLILPPVYLVLLVVARLSVYSLTSAALDLDAAVGARSEDFGTFAIVAVSFFSESTTSSCSAIYSIASSEQFPDLVLADTAPITLYICEPLLVEILFTDVPVASESTFFSSSLASYVSTFISVFYLCRS